MRSSLRAALAIVWISAVLAAAGGCIATPQPNPPNIVVTIDGDEVYSELTNWGGVDILGNPGAIDPPEAVLRVYDVDGSGPSVDVAVEADGSFHAEVDGLYGDEFRLQAILEDDRSEALDLIVDTDGSRPAPRPLSACVTTEPGTWLEVPAGGSAPVELRNDCDEAVTVESVALRFDPTGFSIVRAPAALPARSVDVVEVGFAEGQAMTEDLLLIELSAASVPEVDRRPITLVGVE